jgi:hypothetical protein
VGLGQVANFNQIGKIMMTHHDFGKIIHDYDIRTVVCCQQGESRTRHTRQAQPGQRLHHRRVIRQPSTTPYADACTGLGLRFTTQQAPQCSTCRLPHHGCGHTLLQLLPLP